jgi:hypothetical protein
MVKLVYCLTRRQDVSAAEFSSYWLREHAPKVAERQKALHATKYVQSHAAEPELNVLLQQSRGLQEPYDGVTEIWWESADALREAVASPDGAAAMQQLLEDESTFIDFARSRCFITEEHSVF